MGNLDGKSNSVYPREIRPDAGRYAASLKMVVLKMQLSQIFGVDKYYPGHQLSAGKMKNSPSFLRASWEKQPGITRCSGEGTGARSRTRQLTGRRARWPQPSPTDGRTCPGPLSCQISWSTGFQNILVLSFLVCTFARYLVPHHVAIPGTAVCVSSSFL